MLHRVAHPRAQRNDDVLGILRFEKRICARLDELDKKIEILVRVPWILLGLAHSRCRSEISAQQSMSASHQSELPRSGLKITFFKI